MALKMEEMRNAQRAEGTASILAIGTAVPPNVMYQEDYPDYYFRVTNNEHLTDLKEKFKRICERSTVKKRYMALTEEMLKDNPNMCEHMAPSLDARHDLMINEVPRLAMEASLKAIDEWGQPVSKITHLVFYTASGVDIPGPDYQLVNLLGLRPTVKRIGLSPQGCFAGGTVLRIAKDIAENNRGARVLVVSSEITIIAFRGPSENRIDTLVGRALFGDGAAALIVGSDPDLSIERPLYDLVWTAQTILPDTKGAVEGRLKEGGLTFRLSKDVPNLITKNLEKCLEDAFHPLGVTDWNELFWAVHPGGPAILNQLEGKLKLTEEKLAATRGVLREYGNMSSASVLFILDEVRRMSIRDGKLTTGDGLDWGVLFGFGPGMTVETVVLRSRPTTLVI